MLDPASDLQPPPASPTISSVSSSDLDTESTGSFFHDRSTTLGTLMGLSFPAITFRAPSQHHRETLPVSAGSSSNGSKPKKRRAAFGGAERLGRRRRKWWQLCRDGDTKPASLGEFLEVERRFGDGAFYGVTAELEGVMGTTPRDELEEARVGRRTLFADGRVLPPAAPPHPVGDNDDDDGTSTAGALCRFPVSLTGICSGGVG